MEDVTVSVTSMTQKCSEALAALIQKEGLLQVHQVLPTSLVVAAQDMLHQRLFLQGSFKMRVNVSKL